MGFAFHPNGSDHNGIDDTVERTRGNINMAGGFLCQDTERRPLQFSECEVRREGALNHAWSLSWLIIESLHVTATTFF